jgi:hypothetical protein
VLRLQLLQLLAHVRLALLELLQPHYVSCTVTAAAAAAAAAITTPHTACPAHLVLRLRLLQLLAQLLLALHALP